MQNSFSREINAKGLKLIKDFEACKLEAYICPANVLTIGYGHTLDVKKGQKITQEEADKLLKDDLRAFCYAVHSSIKCPINDNEFSALVCLCFNIGIGAFQKSTLLRLLNEEAGRELVASQFMRWNKINGVESRGLTNRRTKEKELFLEKEV